MISPAHQPATTPAPTPLKAVHTAGIQQPSDIATEGKVIAACLTDTRALQTAVDLLQPDDFYTTKHERIFAAIQAIYNRNERPDYVTVDEEIRKQGEKAYANSGGAAYLVKLASAAHQTANTQSQCLRLIELSKRRKLVSELSVIQERALLPETDAEELLADATQQVKELKQTKSTSNGQALAALVNQSITRIKQVSEDPTVLTGIGTGFYALDAKTNGMQRGELWIVGGRPGMGKTSWMLKVARNAAVKYGHQALVFSLEMHETQLATRLMCMEAGVDMQRARTGALLSSEMREMLDTCEVWQNRLHIDDTAAIDINELAAKARHHHSQFGLDFLAVDYIQLVTTTAHKGERRELQVAKVSRELKKLAKELNIVVLALAQVGRGCEERPDKKPMLYDLRESGSMEQDADNVGFLYRPGYYGFNQDVKGEDLSETGMYIAAKSRNGPTGNFWMRWNASSTDYSDLEPTDPLFGWNRNIEIKTRADGEQSMRGLMQSFTASKATR